MSMTREQWDWIIRNLESDPAQVARVYNNLTIPDQRQLLNSINDHHAQVLRAYARGLRTSTLVPTVFPHPSSNPAWDPQPFYNAIPINVLPQQMPPQSATQYGSWQPYERYPAQPITVNTSAPSTWTPNWLQAPGPSAQSQFFPGPQQPQPQFNNLLEVDVSDPYPGRMIAATTNPLLPPLAPGGVCSVMVTKFLFQSFNHNSGILTPLGVRNQLRAQDLTQAQADYEALALDGDIEQESLFLPNGLMELEDSYYEALNTASWRDIFISMYSNPGRYFLKLSFLGVGPHAIGEQHAIGVLVGSSQNPNGGYLLDPNAGLFQSSDRTTFLENGNAIRRRYHDCTRLTLIKVGLPP
jgi:hypothetical protein